MPYKVIQCFTGAVGSAAIRLAAGDPRVELAGVYVHHPEKAGRDAGELAGTGPLGVLATRDLDSLLDAGADCALWNGDWDAATVTRILRAGVNVYSGTHAYFLRSEPDVAELEQACQHGGVTLAAGGTIPGLISDVFPLFLSGYTGRIRQVRAWQRNHVADLPSAHDLAVGVGFGLPCDQPDASAAIDFGWLGALRQSAAMVAAGARGPAGRVRAVRQDARPGAVRPPPAERAHRRRRDGCGRAVDLQRLCHRAPFYEMRVEMTVALGLGDGWRESVDAPNWRVEIDGTPSLAAELALPVPVGPAIIELNAARAVNMVERVVEAPAGCRSVLDLPAATGLWAGA